jgi:3-dehydrosphinganine reductase
MDLNYWATADMARAILSSWLSPSAAGSKEVRHLVFTASTLVFYPIVGYSPYSPAKAAMRALCDTLYQEIQLYSDTVKIHTVFPGTINTPGFTEENKTKPAITKILEEPDPVQTPDEVARIAIKGLEKGEYFVTVNFLGQAMRACAWGGSVRSNWFVDTVLSWIVASVWFFIAADTNGKVRGYGKKHGHPAAYGKS